MVDVFFSEMMVVKYTLSDLKDAGFIHWYTMIIGGESSFIAYAHTGMSSKSAGTISRIYNHS